MRNEEKKIIFIGYLEYLKNNNIMPSYAEIAKIRNTSRQAAHDAYYRFDDILKKYQEEVREVIYPKKELKNVIRQNNFQYLLDIISKDKDLPNLKVYELCDKYNNGIYNNGHFCNLLYLSDLNFKRQNSKRILSDYFKSKDFSNMNLDDIYNDLNGKFSKETLSQSFIYHKVNYKKIIYRKYDSQKVVYFLSKIKDEDLSNMKISEIFNYLNKEFDTIFLRNTLNRYKISYKKGKYK